MRAVHHDEHRDVARVFQAFEQLGRDQEELCCFFRRSLAVDDAKNAPLVIRIQALVHLVNEAEGAWRQRLKRKEEEDRADRFFATAMRLCIQEPCRVFPNFEVAELNRETQRVERWVERPAVTLAASTLLTRPPPDEMDLP